MTRPAASLYAGTNAEQRITHHATLARDKHEAASLYHQLGRQADQKQADDERWWHLRCIVWIRQEFEG